MKMLPMILVLAATVSAPLSVIASPVQAQISKCQFDPPAYFKNPPAALQAKSYVPAQPATRTLRATSAPLKT
jgi:hypothetical protein